MDFYRDIGARWRNLCCSGKAISITLSKCVFVALINQHAMCMFRTILSSVTYLALPCFYTLSLEGNHLRGKKEATEC